MVRFPSCGLQCPTGSSPPTAPASSFTQSPSLCSIPTFCASSPCPPQPQGLCTHCFICRECYSQHSLCPAIPLPFPTSNSDFYPIRVYSFFYHQLDHHSKEKSPTPGLGWSLKYPHAFSGSFIINYILFNACFPC